jgi:uncharacterized membrane protein HdeD (DUF308 family)
MVATATATRSDLVREDVRGVTGKWWIFLLTGIAWIVVAFIVLQFDMDSVATIGYLVGGVGLVLAANEIVLVAVSPGWRWVHVLLAVLFLLAALFAFAYPGQTFGTLAWWVGWILLFKGTFDVVAALAGRHLPLWGMTLAVGIVEILLAFWTVGYPGRSAYLLVLWVGLTALARGIAEIIFAFQIKHLHDELGGA